MSLTLQEGAVTAVTAALVTGWVALAQGAGPLTSARGYAVLFLVVGQAACAVCAADLARSGAMRAPVFFLGPLSVAAGVGALATGSTAVLGVAVAAMALLWLAAAVRHLHPAAPLRARHARPRHHGVHA